ncbi:E3 ubiquitin-protein ligase TRIM35-like [Alosa sapidissima]|uniref:E3 ubiquitin-protein ligase TRIM35-like n=1 Tax=Alosa sapidissima TaxID=34773 RepID=UPI001C08383A|nr:E3 ubiquitin-protein ligase TRIM35-like [Alosa sapidissima]
MAGDSEVLEYFLSCQICSSTFTDPVSLECNHSFCKMCLCTFWDQDDNRRCPVCERSASNDMPQVNLTLKGLADVFAGRIQENGNAETKQEVLCSVHTVKPTWFCISEDKLVCEGCESITAHAGHKLKLLQEIVEDLKQTITLDLIPLKKQARESKDVEDTYVHMEKHLTTQRARVEKKIKEEFEQLHQFLREEEEARLTAVREEAERKMMIIERELKIIRGQIHAQTKAICRVEVDLKQDNASFYQDYSRTKARVQCKLQDPYVFSGAMLDVAEHLGNLKFNVGKKIVETMDYYPVILDPNTADGWLSVSEDMTTVTEIRTKQDVPDNPERFTKYIYVLGSEGYDSGEHCWEVQVGDRDRWSLGVANESIERKEETFLEPKFGFWTIWMDECKCTVGGIHIELEKRPERIRIQLDYGKGLLSFYDADDMTHIHTYKPTFTEKIYPFFSTETDESTTGIQISPFKMSLIATP